MAHPAIAKNTLATITTLLQCFNTWLSHETFCNSPWNHRRSPPPPSKPRTTTNR